MGLNGYVVIGSAIVGLLVGLTGAGGGALMTPMLILLFSVKPAAAISSNLVAAVVMRPVGALVHLRKGTVNLRLVGLMTLGSVPMAFLGAYLLKRLGDTSSSQQNVEIVLGAALLAGAGAMVLRYFMDRKSGPRTARIAEVRIRPVPTVLIGMVGGLIVGLTSVGSGSLMIFDTPVVLEPSAGQLSSDAGLLPFRQLDERLALTRSFAAVLNDPRDPDLIEHTHREMVRSRVYGILADYEDQNYDDTLLL